MSATTHRNVLHATMLAATLIAASAMPARASADPAADGESRRGTTELVFLADGLNLAWSGLGLGVQHWLGDRFALFGNLQYSDSSDRSRDNSHDYYSSSEYSSQTDYTSYGVQGGVRYFLRPSRRVNPYVGAELGYYIGSSNGNDRSNYDGYADEGNYDDTVRTMKVGLALGVRVRVHDRVEVGGQYALQYSDWSERYSWTGTDEYGGSGRYSSSSIDLVSSQLFVAVAL